MFPGAARVAEVVGVHVGTPQQGPSDDLAPIPTAGDSSDHRASTKHTWVIIAPVAAHVNGQVVVPAGGQVKVPTPRVG